MRRLTVLVPVVLVLCSTSIVQAATLCVAPEATGKGDGSDWSNTKAWGEQPLRGDVWYLADGDYAGMTLDTPNGEGIVITIKKAIPADHGPDVGWSDALGDGQAVFTSSIWFESPFWVFDGQTGGGPGSWNSGFGIKIISTEDDKAVVRMGYEHAASNITLRHLELEGMGSASTQGGGYSNDGLAVYGVGNIELSHAWIHGVGRCPFFLDTADSVIEKVYVESYFGSDAVHSELASIWNFGSLPLGDITFRNNLFTHIVSTGGLMFDNSSNPSSHLYVYGNVFYKPNGASWEQANGLIGGWTGGNGEEMHNVWVFNNTFVNIDQASLSTLPNIATGSRVQNNLWVDSDAPSFEKFSDHDYNHFLNSGDTQGEANGTSAPNGDPFVEVSAWNFNLTENTEPGLDLGPPYDVDPLGHARATWTRGAYEFCEGSSCDPVTDAGVGGSGTGGAASGGTTSTGGSSTGGTNAGGSSAAPDSSDDGGCGCRTVPAKSAHWLFVSVILGLFLARRRRD